MMFASLVAMSELVVGNSLVGLLKSFYWCAKLNVGDRQRRLSGPSVIHAANSQDSISAAIVITLSTIIKKRYQRV